MGATDIYNFVKVSETIDSPKAAYRDLHERALHECGHGGYTGSWAEVPGVVASPLQRGRKLLVSEARRVADDAMRSPDGPGKWEVGHYLVASDPIPGSKRSFTVKLDEQAREACEVRGANGLSAGWVGNIRELESRLGLRDGEQIVSVEVGPTVARQAVKVRATAGKVETRYFVVRNGTSDFGWEHGYATQSEARAAMEAWLRTDPASNVQSRAEVVALRRRAGGAGLVTGERSTTSSTTTLEVTVARPGGTIAGWLLFAVASS